MLLKNRICILFLHYSNDNVTMQNYKLLKKYNPTKNIYPIGFENHNLIDGSHVVSRKQSYPKNDILNETCKREYWSEADLLIYDFYLNYPNLPTYLVIEWDTYCNCSLEQFYGDALNLDHFGHQICTYDELKNWYWYEKLFESQKNLKNLGGIGPTSCLLFSNLVLSSIVKLMTKNPREYDNMFSEIRIGTLLQQSGFILKVPFVDAYKYVNCKDEYISFDPLKLGYYHPVKKLIL